MSWVEPTFSCGECGGDIARWPMKNLLKQDILDWRHRTVPDSVAPHRAVLGTPAHRPRIIDVPKKPPAIISLTAETEQEEVVEALETRRLAGRPALRDDLPAVAQRLDKKAADHGWTVAAGILEGDRDDGTPLQIVVLFLVRDGHHLTTSWSTKRDSSWQNNESYSFGHRVRQVGSRELGKIVEEPRRICESCGKPPALHILTPGGPVCDTGRTNPKEES